VATFRGQFKLWKALLMKIVFRLFDKTACYLVAFDSVIFSKAESSGRKVNV